MLAVFHTVLSVLLGALLLTTAGGKLAGAAPSHAIRDSLHVPAARWRAIGAFELLIVVTLMLGIWLRPWAITAGTGVVLLMAGAISTRVRAGGEQQRSGVQVDTVVLLLGLVTLTLMIVAPA